MAVRIKKVVRTKRVQIIDGNKIKRNKSYQTAVLNIINKHTNREELTRKRINVLASGPDYYHAVECLKNCCRELPCGLSACVECAYLFRFKYTVSALQAFREHKVMYYVTILDRAVQINELNGIKNKPKNIAQRIKRIFAKNGLGSLKGFGDIEYCYENENTRTLVQGNKNVGGRFILHYHLVFCGDQKEQVEALRDCFPNGSLNRRVLIREIKNDLKDRAKVFSYCCKRVDYYRPKLIMSERNIYPRAIPIPLQYRRVLLNYLAKYRMSELQLHFNIPVTGGSIIDGY